MGESGHTQAIDIAFGQILGITPPEGFGEPFTTAFSRLYNGSEEEIMAAAYICSLFLSALLEEYPTARLHTFVHHAQESHGRFSFNCDMYGNIFKEMDKEALHAVCLLGGDNIPTVRACSKEDIFEAFDFYTNR